MFDEPFILSLLFMSVAGLILCQCLKALVLQRIIKMPNSWERDPNLSLREREREKNTIFCIFLEMQGHKEMRILQC